jgi:two-component system, NarL family, response regulator DesR
VCTPAGATWTPRSPRPPCPLTERELELLRHVHEGRSATAIATQVHLAPGTVRNYLSTAMAKLGAPSRAEAARTAYEEGWI